MKKWSNPEILNLDLNETRSNFCEYYTQCSYYLSTYKPGGDEGHIPGECQFTCPICKGCNKPGNSPNHNQCPSCGGEHSPS